MRRSHVVTILLLGVVLLVPTSALAAVPHGSPLATTSSRRVMDEDVGPTHLKLATRAAVADVALRWAADDGAVAAGETSQTWTWGPRIFRTGDEPYREAPNRFRTVWYLDKARMEVTYPDLDPDNAWYVTSGLLVRELISGLVQAGDNTYEEHTPANIPLAGDLDALPEQTITFQDLQSLASLANDKRVPSRREYDPIVVEQLGKGGAVTQEERLLQYDVRLTGYDEVLGHNIAQVFVDAMPPEKLLYTAGRPLIEPYWIVVPVNHVATAVLVQAFERRILTYTPSNPEGWKVEWGNVGRQYAQWRYRGADEGAPVDPVLELEAKPAVQKLEVLAPKAAAIAEQHSGSVGVAVLNMRTAEIYSLGGTRAFPMYSTAKVPIMLGVLNRVQREKRAVAAWEDNLIRDMIQRSDNDAATSLIIHAGGAAEVNRYLRAIGINSTTMDNESWGYSTTTTEDMVRLTAKLGNCTILNAELCHYALEIMRNVTPEQRWGIDAGAPTRGSIAIKNGWFPEQAGWTINSIGYVKGQRARYAIAIYTRPNSSMRAGIDTIEAIATELHRAMN